MIKVKEYLDKCFYTDGKSTATRKPDGHYCVSGYWEYPEDISKSESIRINEHMKIDPSLKNWISKNQMSFICNNETLSIRMIIIDGKSVGHYGYLQTYQHIPRIGPDQYGYYARSTDEEVIKYIDGYFRKIKSKERYWKLKKLMVWRKKL